MHDLKKTPPSSPSTTDKRDNYEPTVEKKKQEKQKEGKNKTKGGSTSLKPTSSVIRKTKEQMKHRMASYESIEAEGRRSTESIKDAVRAAKETKEKLLTPNKRPKIRILLGMLLGLLLGVFIFLTLHLLAHLHKILQATPERMKTQEMPPDVNDHSVITTGEGEHCGFVKILAMLLPLLGLVVLYEAYRYHKLYLSCNEFDNHFLTLRFKSIEDMRKSSGAADLLVPLKKAELQRFVQPTGCRLAESEKRNMLKYLLFYFIYLIFALMVILLDHYFYLVVTNEEPQSNIHKRCINGDLKSLDMVYVIILSTLLGILLLIILLQAFILRLRRLITSRFYPRRERKRIAYLYYKLLEERKTFYKSVIENMNNFSEETEMLNRLDAVLVLCNNFSWIKAVFEFVGINIRRCAVCGTGLNRKYLYCDTEDCDVIYCRTCFWDLENKCLGCMRNSKMTSRSSSLSGQSQRRKNDYVKPV
ncbi:DC-STAMP-like protein [Desmophyllum pertusum]|uniref:DC-STAMP-like protein n=1 Tax=Desmophyllum pertusum TaxID=174260 RepID=A0A9W9YSD6_9CNID|nr:DC-STAMP-like protein [Desmophyllum pertusum]